MTVFFIAFLTILLAEFGDKTQLVTLTLSSRFPPRQVLPGALGALAAISALAAILGDFLSALLPQEITLVASGLFFLGVGFWMILKKDVIHESTEEPKHNVTMQTFTMVFFAELGDKTQLAVIALTAAYGAPLIVFLGAMSGQLVNHVLAAYLGSRLLSRLPGNKVRLASAYLFLFFGAIFLLSIFL